jgi:hypothetical protein
MKIEIINMTLHQAKSVMLKYVEDLDASINEHEQFSRANSNARHEGVVTGMRIARDILNNRVRSK